MLTGRISNNMRETLQLKFFGVNPKYKGGVTVTEVRWYRPPPEWYKVNFNGAALGQPGRAACGGNFRVHRGFILGTYALRLGVQTAIFAELVGFIRAVEIAVVKN